MIPSNCPASPTRAIRKHRSSEPGQLAGYILLCKIKRTKEVINRRLGDFDAIDAMSACDPVADIGQVVQSVIVTLFYLRNSCTFAALALLAGCSTAIELPAFEDTYAERECSCVTGNDCPIAEMAEGQSEERQFQCRWQNQAGARSTCTYQTRFLADDVSARDVAWSKVTVRLRHLGSKGWCWTDRS